jgi:hypothetical protein
MKVIVIDLPTKQRVSVQEGTGEYSLFLLWKYTKQGGEVEGRGCVVPREIQLIPGP